jgi:hypothetical protein
VRTGEHLDIERLPVVFEERVAERIVALVQRPSVVFDDSEIHPGCLAEIRD